MNQPIKWVENQMPKTSDSQLKVMALEEIRKARTFHESFPQYSKTPLRKLDEMA
ncbi:MAG: diaminopropionate ammonia-lyase, partial [Lachnospiraceae bacterium]|nr:diaminopropionate ammonia-lyase [Lachnospiraceae bacterium]